MTEDFKRKLTAILSADVEGYSRLMGEDEDSTVRTLTSYRNLMSSLIERYHGQVVDSPGDNLLAEFESVRDAVQCAVEIQEELKVRNADLPDNRKMQFRIGVNLGDIIKDEGRIYGDGVNVAARIESLADAGGICLSSSAYDQVKKKLNYEYVHLGEYEVKNIDEPVSVYKVLMVSNPAGKVVEEKKIGVGTSRKRNIAIILIIIIAALLVWRFYSSQHIKTEPGPVVNEQITITSDVKEAPKSIAVLPFDNLSSDPEQDYFVLGLSEEILNSLTQIPKLTVIAKTSSFVFKDKDKTIQEIASVLGVDHILE
ncbi:adenylate/guanylate cyclase domain-containing protein, partial [Thermodesulfobacteriota bacterium]